MHNDATQTLIDEKLALRDELMRLVLAGRALLTPCVTTQFELIRIMRMIDPAAIAAELTRRGWQDTGVPEYMTSSWHRWTRPREVSGLQAIDVPISQDVNGYARWVRQCIEDMAAADGHAVAEVLARLMVVPLRSTPPSEQATESTVIVSETPDSAKDAFYTMFPIEPVDTAALRRSAEILDKVPSPTDGTHATWCEEHASVVLHAADELDELRESVTWLREQFLRLSSALSATWADRDHLRDAGRLLAVGGDDLATAIAEVRPDAFRAECERRGWEFLGTELVGESYDMDGTICTRWRHSTGRTMDVPGNFTSREDLYDIVECIGIIAETASPQAPAEVLARLLVPRLKE